MSFTDKLVKNTYFHLLSQAVNLLSPFILIPVIISSIGAEDYGIYVLVLGFIGTFGLLDLSFSSSFVKFIAEYYNKKQNDKLIEIINTGFLFYLIFSTLTVITALLISDYLFGLVNIPPEKYALAKNVFYLSLSIFFFGSSFGIFNSLLIGLQKMYQGAIASIFVSIGYFTAVLILMLTHSGLFSLMIAQLASGIISVVITLILAKRNLPGLVVTPRKFTISRLKEMSKFGIQIQVSRLSTFASEKYDEFLLGAFSTLGNVTLYNLGSKAASYGKFIPLQFMAPIAPAAAELSAMKRDDKLKELYLNAVKYLNMLAIPIFIFLFFFSDRLFIAWMGPGYETSILISRILIVGYLSNFLFSVPGNIIIPNTGAPKFQMREGLIFLGINIIASYFLIKKFGITGAAFGNAISVVISSVYILIVSSRFFKVSPLKIIPDLFTKPFLFSIIPVIPLLIFFYLTGYSSERVFNILYVSAAALFYFTVYLFLLVNFTYLNSKDYELITKFLIKLPPFNLIAEKERQKLRSSETSNKKIEVSGIDEIKIDEENRQEYTISATRLKIVKLFSIRRYRDDILHYIKRVISQDEN
jgi:O-antigen/teichoic acid export membrane protein